MVTTRAKEPGVASPKQCATEGDARVFEVRGIRVEADLNVLAIGKVAHAKQVSVTCLDLTAIDHQKVLFECLCKANVASIHIVQASAKVVPFGENGEDVEEPDNYDKAAKIESQHAEKPGTVFFMPQDAMQPLVGVYRTPVQAIQASLTLKHPLEFATPIPDLLTRCVVEVLNMGINAAFSTYSKLQLMDADTLIPLILLVVWCASAGRVMAYLAAALSKSPPRVLRVSDTRPPVVIFTDDPVSKKRPVCSVDWDPQPYTAAKVQDIRATDSAFAAIRSDGCVVTWGAPECGGDSSAVQKRLIRVQEIRASEGAFAAILADGEVVTWGPAEYGGDCSTVQEKLKDVQDIRASEGAFTALRGDGTAVAWGSPHCGGDCSAVEESLTDVQEISASQLAFAALKSDGSAVAWGPWYAGGDCSRVADELTEVRGVQATETAFAALRADGSVVTWGCAGGGGDSSTVREQLKDVREIQSSEAAFAAILADGSVVTWGAASCGGDSSRVKSQLCNVQEIV
ncbi:unnamed protein product [Symbiodinium sp. CCMP2592]|nr:unnamed protein product [Symbiodinium sp. CCMP2592]